MALNENMTELLILYILKFKAVAKVPNKISNNNMLEQF